MVAGGVEDKKISVNNEKAEQQKWEKKLNDLNFKDKGDQDKLVKYLAEDSRKILDNLKKNGFIEKCKKYFLNGGIATDKVKAIVQSKGYEESKNKELFYGENDTDRNIWAVGYLLVALEIHYFNPNGPTVYNYFKEHFAIDKGGNLIEKKAQKKNTPIFRKEDGLEKIKPQTISESLSESNTQEKTEGQEKQLQPRKVPEEKEEEIPNSTAPEKEENQESKETLPENILSKRWHVIKDLNLIGSEKEIYDSTDREKEKRNFEEWKKRGDIMAYRREGYKGRYKFTDDGADLIYISSENEKKWKSDGKGKEKRIPNQIYRFDDNYDTKINEKGKIEGFEDRNTQAKDNGETWIFNKPSDITTINKEDLDGKIDYDFYQDDIGKDKISEWLISKDWTEIKEYTELEKVFLELKTKISSLRENVKQIYRYELILLGENKESPTKAEEEMTKIKSEADKRSVALISTLEEAIDEDYLNDEEKTLVQEILDSQKILQNLDKEGSKYQRLPNGQLKKGDTYYNVDHLGRLVESKKKESREMTFKDDKEKDVKETTVTIHANPKEQINQSPLAETKQPPSFKEKKNNNKKTKKPTTPPNSLRGYKYNEKEWNNYVKKGKTPTEKNKRKQQRINAYNHQEMSKIRMKYGNKNIEDPIDAARLKKANHNKLRPVGLSIPGA